MQNHIMDLENYDTFNIINAQNLELIADSIMSNTQSTMLMEPSILTIVFLKLQGQTNT